jgi:myosin heavy subunit
MIINASPIMEAFGNASTCRNANSSRFGKWISLQLDDSYRVRGAFIQAFMLELPRVIQHLEGDRSYHIFYHVLRMFFFN